MKRLYEAAAYDTATWPESYWRATAGEGPRHPPLEGDGATEVAVIGAGYTGLNAALELAERHATGAVVLEAGQPGWGASGRNGGFACAGGTKLSHGQVIARFGRPAADAFHAFQSEAIARVADNLSRYGIDADRVAPPGEICLAQSPRAMEGLRDWAGFMNREFGASLDVLERDALAERGYGPARFHGAVFDPASFGLHPLKYVLGLARAARDAGVTIHGDSPVTAIRREGAAWRLVTPRGSLTARRVIVATNGYGSEDLPEALAGRVLPVMTSILVTRPLSPDDLEAQGWTSTVLAYDARALLHYFRLLPDGRFLFGTRGGIGAGAAAMARVRRMGRAHFEALFPAWRDVETPYFWGGFAALTRQLTPYVGPADGAEGIVLALGYHGNGVTTGSAAGRLAGALAAGAPPETVPAVLRQPLRRFPLARFRRWGLALAYAGYRMKDGPLTG